MKKYLLRVLPVLAACVALLLLMTACGHEHDFGEWEVEDEPTCTRDGEQVRECECGELDYEDIDALGHTDGEWITDAEPTCTEDGSKHQVCSVCEETIQTEVLPATGHTDGEWTTDVEPTCTKDGSKHQVCSVCEDTIQTVVIAALGHRDGEWITDAEPTCTKEGSKHQECSVCEDTIKTETLAATGKHDYEGRITTSASCTADGVKTFTCTGCADSYTEKIAATGHTEVIDRARSATCTQTGLTEGKHCSTCGYVFVKQTETPRGSHSISHGKCSGCGTVTDAYAALAYYVYCNGTVDEDGEYWITEGFSEDGTTFSAAIVTDRYASTITLFALMETNDMETFVMIELEKNSTSQPIAVTVETNSLELAATGTIYINTFSESNAYIYNYNCVGVSSSVGQQLKPTIAQTVDLSLQIMNLLIFEEHNTGVTMSMLGFKNY